VLKEIFAGKVTDDFTRFLDFLSRKNRIAIVENIAESYLEIKDEREGIVTVALTTAVDFGDELIADLKERFESVLSKKVRFTFRKDEAIIGGFVAKVQDTVYDASIAHQLELLKKKFTESALTGNS
jgi:F-type H+-transporting ATPase subunit delta